MPVSKELTAFQTLTSSPTVFFYETSYRERLHINPFEGIRKDSFSHVSGQRHLFLDMGA